MALLMVIRRMHAKKLAADGAGWIDPKQNNRTITVHGFQSCFDDWATETTAHDDKAIDYSLAHKLPDKVRSAYQRGDMFMKRIQLMADWSRYCDTIPAAAVVREKTIKLTGAINMLSGYKTVNIHSPMEVIDDEKTRYHLGRDSRNTPQD